jgi:hypothetical protein
LKPKESPVQAQGQTSYHRACDAGMRWPGCQTVHSSIKKKKRLVNKSTSFLYFKNEQICFKKGGCVFVSTLKLYICLQIQIIKAYIILLQVEQKTISDRCYEIEKIFAEKYGENIGVFCSNYCYFLQIK